ncbi:MAG: hypothetical protein KC657_03280 [Myxococcales bacterium]|nr:hypothetical protein [Myxococcales bacterium]
MPISPRATLAHVAVVGATIAVTLVRPAWADAPDAGAEHLVATMECDRAAEPGRVRCSVEARADGGAIVWGDVQIVDVPSFITPLKGRIGVSDATTREPSAWRWALALVARQTGQGRVHARVRLLHCADADKTRCVPVVREVTAQLSVGR